MNLKQAMKRIEELERKVRELETKQPHVVHHHYHQQQPLVGAPLPAPVQPTWPQWPQVWCGGAGIQGAADAGLTWNGNGYTYGPDH